jgi:hypothetical protein
MFSWLFGVLSKDNCLFWDRSPHNAQQFQTRDAIGAIIDGHAIGTFNIRTTKSKVVKTGDGTDVAARYFVYKLYEATGGQPMQWQVLLGMGESAATISRAVERGLVVLQGDGGKPLERKAMLTSDGRRLARKGR